MKLIAALSPAEVNAIINGDPKAVYKTVRGSTMNRSGIVDHVVQVSNADIVSIFGEISKDSNFVNRVVEEAKLDTIEITAGYTSSSRPVQFTQEIMIATKSIGGEIPGVVAGNLKSVIISFIVHRFGNKEV